MQSPRGPVCAMANVVAARRPPPLPSIYLPLIDLPRTICHQSAASRPSATHASPSLSPTAPRATRLGASSRQPSGHATPTGRSRDVTSSGSIPAMSTLHSTLPFMPAEIDDGGLPSGLDEMHGPAGLLPPALAGRRHDGVVPFPLARQICGCIPHGVSGARPDHEGKFHAVTCVPGQGRGRIPPSRCSPVHAIKAGLTAHLRRPARRRHAPGGMKVPLVPGAPRRRLSRENGRWCD